MDIWKNKKTGKGFVYVEDAGLTKAIFVTPDGKVLVLEKELFEKPKAHNQVTATEQQTQTYIQYLENREADAAQRKQWEAELTPEEIIKLYKEAMERKRKELTPQEWAAFQQQQRRILYGED